MRGLKTYIVSLLTFSWGVFGLFRVVPDYIWDSIALCLLSATFFMSRWALRDTWAGAYKVYVREVEGRKKFKNVMPIIRGDNVESK